MDYISNTVLRVALAFLFTGNKTLPVLLTGAVISGVLGMLCIQFVTQFTRVKADSAIGIVLSVFFGIGIVLLTHIQRVGGGNQAGLDKFLFGQAASLVGDDLVVMLCLVFAIICFVLPVGFMVLSKITLSVVGRSKTPTIFNNAVGSSDPIPTFPSCLTVSMAIFSLESIFLTVFLAILEISLSKFLTPDSLV